MLDIFELSPIDEKDYEDIQRGIAKEAILAYLNFMIVCTEHKDEIRAILNNKRTESY